MSDERDPSSFTQKEILTEWVMPALDGIKEQLEKDRERTNARLEKLETGHNMMRGALALIMLFMVPLSVPVVSALLSFHHA